MPLDGLLERNGELEALDAAIERAARGDGGLLIVEGPAGIGKSRLLAEARKRAERELRVLSARGSQLEREFSFGVVRQLLEAELASPQRREALLTNAAAPAAAVFGDLQADADGASFAALHGLFWLVLNLAEERPLLLAVDDLHWCDRPSLLFIAYLASRLEGQAILVLAGLRSADPGTDAALLAEIARDPAVTSLRPRPLTDEAVVAFTEERLGAAPDGAFAHACRDATGGNPLLLTQLVLALRSEQVRPDAEHVRVVKDIGPRAVSRTVLLRLARLPPEAAPVARAVAILGDGAALPTVVQLAGIDERRAAEATRALAQAEILNPEAPLAFVHPLVRDAVYHELPAAERELEHARAAELLRDRGAPTENVAAQLLHVSPRGEPWIAGLLLEAGRAAMHAGAADSAVSYLRRALDEPPPDAERARVLLELGTAETFTHGPAAADHLALAYETLADPAERATAAGLLGRTLMFMGAVDEASDIAARAAGELPEDLADLRRQLEAFGYMTVLFGAREPSRLDRLRPYREPPGPSAGARMLAAMAAWEWALTDGTAEQCARLALAALEGGELIEADNALISFAAIVTLVLADHPEAGAAWERSMAEAHRRGSLFSMSSNHLWIGFTLLRRGELADAEEALRAALDEYSLWGMGEHAKIHTGAFLTDVLLERGRLEEAASTCGRLAATNPGHNSTGWWLRTRAALLIAQGEPEAAAAAASELGRHCETIVDPARYWWRGLKAEALDLLGRTEEAIALVREELELTRHFGGPWVLGRSLRVLGTLGRDAGLDTLRDAVAVLAGSTARLEHAKALAALGAALRRARKPAEAREPLLRALELATVCGAEGLAESARSELYSAGFRPRRDALSGPEALTARERRVAHLASAGRTNREIAQELFVTPKTVELHLSNAYRKLGIGSRRELEHVLG